MTTNTNYKNRVPIVYFAYDRDAALLEQSLRGVARLRVTHPGVEIPVYVFDDAEHPLAEVPEGVHYARTSFARHGNLNGEECVNGMLECFAGVLEAEGSGFVVKCDCDTYINSLGFVLGSDPDACSQLGTYNRMGFFPGIMYAVSARGVAYARHMMSGGDTVVRLSRTLPGLNEDMVMYRLLRTMPGMMQRDIRDGHVAGFVNGTIPYVLDMDRLKEYTCVTFKAYTGWIARVGGDKEAEMASAETRMREYADSMEAGTVSN